ncbi:MAG TPA: multidrug RND transporter [Kosmotogaceae bacterium]|nr:multidrug RND transporter [Kosmotogaceae bacterium]
MRKILAYSFVAISVLVAVSVFVNLSYDASYDAYLDEDDPYISGFLNIGEKFGDKGMLFLILERYDQMSQSLVELKAITAAIEELPWVSRVYSVLDALKFGRFDLLRFDLPVEPYIIEEGSVFTMDAAILDDPLYADLFVSADGRSLSVLITLDIEATEDNERIVEEIKVAVEGNTEMKYFLVGENVASYATFKAIREMMLIYPPLVLFSILVVYYIGFRRPILPVLSLIPAILSAVWVTSLMNFLGKEINILTVMIPSFIMIIGSAYGMHFLTIYCENANITVHSERIRRTIREERVPVYFSAFTTMAGFSSYLFLDMQAFRDLGVFVCLGIFLSALLTMVLLPALLSDKSYQPATKRRVLIIRRMPAIVTRGALFLVIVMIFLSPFLISRISMNIDQYAFFKEDSQVTIAVNEMRERFGWTSVYYLMMEIGEEHERTSFYASELRAFSDLVLEVADSDMVSKTLDIGTYSRATGIPEPLLQRIVDADEGLQSASALFVKDNAVRAILFSPLSDTESAGEMERIVSEAIMERQEELPDVKLFFASTSLIWRSVNSNVVSNQIQSLTVSFVLILCMLLFIFRRVKYTLAMTVPILLTAVFSFVLMSLTGISLNISTALLSGMLMGLVIDYSIHFAVWYRRFRDSSKTLQKTSGPIIANALGLVVGFSVLFTAPLVLYVDVALLMVGSLTFGVMTTLVLLPGILKKI